jgi:TetR/AcrR family transcriptional regulator, transcriptional repressor for nem operon
MPRHAPQAAPNRDRIVAAAMRLFASRGYSATSIADIASAAGMLKGNLAYYFKNKPDLLAAVTEARFQVLFGQLQAAAAGAATPRNALECLLSQIESTRDDLARHGCPIGSLCGELARVEPALQPHALSVMQALQAWVQGRFEQTMPAQAAQACAEQLLCMIQGASAMAQATGDAQLVLRQMALARQWLSTLLPDAGGQP